MPQSVRTFLFTDIEGSSRLWERHPEEMSPAVARHDALSREAVNLHRGAVVKMSGDGIHAVFADPLDALHAAAAIQQALARPAPGPAIRVRAGIHTGPCEERDGDFFGTTVNRAARIANAANGGQIVLSDAVVQSLGALPEPLATRNLGVLRLRDLAEAEPIHQLLHPDLPADFPPLRSLAVNPNNLPHLPTSFVGRHKELAEIERLFGQARLVSLLGVGGIGKTRLALQSAAYRLDHYEDGVWLVELAALHQPELLAQTAAAALGVKERTGLSAQEALLEHLRARRLLLILDNCEHLVDGCARLVDTLLRAAPNLHILATSREGLEIDGEAAYAVPALSLPDPDFEWRVGALRDVESVRLFMERAALQRPGFHPEEHEAVLLARICYRLDGIPLAIELAAARMRTAGLADISAGLDDRFGYLTTGSRVALPRQKTLRAMIDWSHDLLSAEEKTLFARLSVFVGGAGLPVVLEVCISEASSAEQLPALLQNLVDKSLLQIQGEAPEMARYGFLETLREYAAERLAVSGEADILRARHATSFSLLAARTALELHGTITEETLRGLDREQDNLRAALAWYREQSQAAEFVALAASLSRYWFLRGGGREAREVLARALATDGGLPADRAEVHYGAAVLAYLQADPGEAIAHGVRARELHREEGNQAEAAKATTIVAYATYVRDGHQAALPLYLEMISNCEASGNRAAQAVALTNLATNALYAGDGALARETMARALALLKEHPDPRAQSNADMYLGLAAEDEGDFEAALHAYQRHWDGVRALGEIQREGVSLFMVARACDRLGRVEEALTHYLRSLRLLHERRLTLELMNALENFAGMLAARGQPRAAGLLCGATAAERSRVGINAGDQSRRTRALALNPAREALGEAALESALAERAGLGLDRAIALALSATLGGDGVTLVFV